VSAVKAADSQPNRIGGRQIEIAYVHAEQETRLRGVGPPDQRDLTRPAIPVQAGGLGVEEYRRGGSGHVGHRDTTR
jgi:hypothetical protein